MSIMLISRKAPQILEISYQIGPLTLQTHGAKVTYSQPQLVSLGVLLVFSSTIEFNEVLQ